MDNGTQVKINHCFFSPFVSLKMFVFEVGFISVCWSHTIHINSGN